MRRSNNESVAFVTDDRSIPVVNNDIQNLMNFVQQAYAGRDQQQVRSLIAALSKAKAVMMGQPGYYTPTPASYPQAGGVAAPSAAVAVLAPTRLNAQQKQFFDNYIQVGIVRGRDAILKQMNANPYHTEPFKEMVTKFWDKQVSPKMALRKQTTQNVGQAA